VSPKTETLTFRIDPGVKDLLRTIADREHRSIANTVEILIIRHAESIGMQVKPPDDKTPEKTKGEKKGKA